MSASGSVRAAAAAVWRWIRSAPGTYLWLAALGVTTAIQLRLSPEEARIWLGHRSTNLDRLGDDPIRVLIGSAFWTDGGGWLVYAVLFSLVHANAERWLGTLRWLVVVVLAHVGATYLSQGVLLWAIRHDRAPERAAFALDVGVSYGLAGVAAVLAYRVLLPWRALYVLGVLAVCVPPVFLDRTFTDVGHAGAALIGFACYPLTRGRDRGWNPTTRWRAFLTSRRVRRRLGG
ncbi:rhomboid-like protein [Nocardia sp. NPDC058518]|uniref:rhomboid-like protein n=1 Tax=Nocardia sp. NPDC058518 TaxID=3346534 RepID=UPI00364A508F